MPTEVDDNGSAHAHTKLTIVYSSKGIKDFHHLTKIASRIILMIAIFLEWHAPRPPSRSMLIVLHTLSPVLLVSNPPLSTIF